MKPINSYLSQFNISPEASPTPPESTAVEREGIKRLDALEYGHLDADQRELLEQAVVGALTWMSAFRHRPGLSYVITGGYGTGKTTILQNMRAAGYQAIRPMVWNWELGREVPDPYIEPTVIPTSGRFWTATEAMAALDPGRRDSGITGWGEVGASPLSHMLAGVDVLLIDDIGTEEIPYTAATDRDTVRQNRYRELLDYCLGSRGGPRISVLVSSNVPLIAGGAANPDFVNIIGGAAWSRLYDHASGLMFDLTGLPDWRMRQPKAR